MTVAPQQLYTLRSSYTELTYSKDDLRRLVAHVEQSFTQSDIYGRALQRLQDRLGSTANGLQLLVNALGREAIRLTLREFISAVTHPQTVPISTPTSISDLASSSTAIQPQPEQLDIVDSTDALVSQAATTKAAITPSTVPSTPPGLSLGTTNLGTTIAIPEYPVLSDENTSHSPEDLGYTKPTEPTHRLANPQPQIVERITDQPTVIPKHFTSPNHQAAARRSLRSQPSTAREEILDSIGQTLRDARTRKQLSIEQLHQRTCVPGHHIRALEDGMWQNLPEDIYLKGFIRLLGNALGLDGHALSHSLATNSLESSGPSVVPFSRSTTKASSPKPSAQLNQSHLYLGYAALMAGATGGLAWMVSQPASSPVDLLHGNSNLPQALSAMNQSKQVSFQELAQRIVQQMGAIATPETNPPEQPPTAGP